jgi:hypothetical protein
VPLSLRRGTVTAIVERHEGLARIEVDRTPCVAYPRVTGPVVLGDEAFAVRPGSVVGRPAGTGVAHQFLSGDEEDRRWAEDAPIAVSLPVVGTFGADPPSSVERALRQLRAVPR